MEGKRERSRRIKRNGEGAGVKAQGGEEGIRNTAPKSAEGREGEWVQGEEGGSGSSTRISAAVVESPSIALVGEGERREIQSTSLNGGKESSPIRPGKSEAANEASKERERSQSSSPTNAQTRPLLVDHYENFPFNTSSNNPTREENGERTRKREGVRQETHMKPPYSFVRSASSRSGTSQHSITPPLPDRHYSMSEVNRSPTPPLPERQYLILSPSEGESSQPTSVFIPTHRGAGRESHEGKLGADLDQISAVEIEEQAEEGDEVRTLPTVQVPQRRVVTRTVSQGGDEYAVINPAWKRNVERRSPSLTDEGENDDPSEISPPLPERLLDMRSPTGSSMSPDGSVSGVSPGYASVDTGFVHSKQTEMNVKSNPGGYASVDAGFVHSKQTEMNVKSNPGGYASVDAGFVHSKQTEMNVKSNPGGYASVDAGFVHSKQTEMNVKSNPGGYASVDAGFVHSKQTEMNVKSNPGGYASVDAGFVQSKQTEMNVKSNPGGYASVDAGFVQSKQTEMNVKSNPGGYASVDAGFVQSKQTEMNIKSNPGGFASIDAGFVQSKQTEMNISSRVINSPPYCNVQTLPPGGHNLRLSKPPQGKGAPRMCRHTYEEVYLVEEPVEGGESVEMDPVNQDTSGEFKQ